MLRLAASELGFDPRRSFVIGDKNCDIELGRNAGATTLLVRTGYGSDLGETRKIDPDYVVDDLDHAALLVERLISTGKN